CGERGAPRAWGAPGSHTSFTPTEVGDAAGGATSSAAGFTPADRCFAFGNISVLVELFSIYHFSPIHESYIFRGVALCVFLHIVCELFHFFFLFFFFFTFCCHDRFKSSTVKECIRAILKERLADVQYKPEEMAELTKSLSDTIKDRLKDQSWKSSGNQNKAPGAQGTGREEQSAKEGCDYSLTALEKEEGFDRYKMVVQVVIGEQRGEGVNMAARCFWDADTDSCAHDVFMNDSLFCVVAAFGCFYY
uniref:Dynein light chain Tctex-type 2B n=1 Tax=Zonotrichia albicollis TaxID=44394 RepID=A0A8D2MGR2_ZONAL